MPDQSTEYSKGVPVKFDCFEGQVYRQPISVQDGEVQLSTSTQPLQIYGTYTWNQAYQCWDWAGQ